MTVRLSFLTGRSTVFRCLKIRRGNRHSFSRFPPSPESDASTFLTSRRASRSFWTLSFSGAGHLMPYHLGVAKTLLSHEEEPLPIRAVSGSSSGAIAATVLTLLPHRLEEYTERFLQDRGHAFRNLRELLLEEELSLASETFGKGIVLSICTTRCSDGGIELFSFGGESSENAVQTDDEEFRHRMLTAVEASCKIPRSFHPFDMVALRYQDRWQVPSSLLQESRNTTASETYPHEEGIIVEEQGYVDGGIAAPFPPTLLDGDPACTRRILVSPIAGEYFYQTTNQAPPKNLPDLQVVSPDAESSSWKAPFINTVTISGSGGHHNVYAPLVAVRATASLQNFRVLTTAMGVVPASPNHNNKNGGGGGILRDWYQRGQEDAHELLVGLE